MEENTSQETVETPVAVVEETLAPVADEVVATEEAPTAEIAEAEPTVVTE